MADRKATHRFSLRSPSPLLIGGAGEAEPTDWIEVDESARVYEGSDAFEIDLSTGNRLVIYKHAISHVVVIKN